MKLAIISHTEHYRQSDGTVVGWGPTVSEINHLVQDFDEIIHIAFLHPGVPPPSSLPYTSSKIKFVSLKPVGGKDFAAKLNIIWQAPKIIATVQKTLKGVDVFQLRTPTGIGVFLIPYLTLFNNKMGWYKYAGNWNQQKAPLGYAFQRWMLKKQKRKVTINGNWPHQPKHCLTFENPCLTGEERQEGLKIIENKIYSAKFTFCFAGRLDNDKGVQRIIDAFANLKSLEKVETIHFIGNGENMERFIEECNSLKLPVIFHGFLERKKVFQIYKQSNFILLPSTASEGFPKVIAEAMNYGCLPLVSNVSSITQYVGLENGFIIEPCTAGELTHKLEKALNEEASKLKTMAFQAHRDVVDFTFENYRHKIQTIILK